MMRRDDKKYLALDINVWKLCSVLAVGLSLSTAAFANGLVIRLETALAQLGYQPGAIDGVVDQATYNAIYAYQRERGLAETGGVDLAGLEAMELEVARAEGASNSQPPTPQANTVAPNPREERNQVYDDVRWQISGDLINMRTVQAINASGSRLVIQCRLTPSERGVTGLTFENATSAMQGPVQVIVDGTAAYVWEDAPQVNIASEAQAERFVSMVNALSTGSQALLIDRDGRQTVIPLQGSERAIGGCRTPIFSDQLMTNEEVASETTVGEDHSGRFNGEVGPFFMQTYLRDGHWCAPHISIRADVPVEVYDPATGDVPPSAVSSFATAMQSACPAMRSMQVAFNPGPSDRPWAQYVPPGFLQLLGAQDGFTSFTTYREIEASLPHEPVSDCARVASMPGDYDKPLGFAGVATSELIASSDHLNVCRQAVERDPDDRTALAMYGRLLAHAGLFEDALEVLGRADRLGSGMAMSYIGTMQVEGFGMPFDMAMGNRSWGRSQFFGGQYVRVSGGQIAASTGVELRPTEEELQREAAQTLLEGIAIGLAGASQGGSFTMCNNRDERMRVATIALVPSSNPTVFVEGFEYIDSGRCGTISSDVHPLMVYGVAIELEGGSGWYEPLLTLRDSDPGIPHRFQGICVPESDSFVRNEVGMMEINPCRSEDRALRIQFNTRVGRTHFTMNVN